MDLRMTQIKRLIYQILRQFRLNKKLKQLSDARRVYHFHIRKTAGTTVNIAFIGAFFNDLDPKLAYESLSTSEKGDFFEAGKRVVGWTKNELEEGIYNYGFSHMPYHKIIIPKGVKTFTCFRDPVKRVVSHYNMLKYFEVNAIDHPCMKYERHWIKEGFEGFVDAIPKEHLLNQLYMFSASFSVDEALNNLKNLDFIIMTEQLEIGMSSMGIQLDLAFKLGNEKKYNHRELINDSSLALLRQKLQPEYEMLEKMKQFYSEKVFF